MFFALVVLFTLVGIIGALAWASVPAFQKFGLGFFVTNVWNPVTMDFGALAPIYGTLVTSAIALADRRAGELRHRAVPDRDVPGRPQAAARHRGRAAGGDSVDHLRHVGPVRVRAGFRRLRPAGAHEGLRRPVDSGAAVSRRAERHRRAVGRHHPVDHGDSVHRLGHARRVRDRAAGAEGVGLRHRRDDVGSGLERRAAVHQGRA